MSLIFTWYFIWKKWVSPDKIPSENEWHDLFSTAAKCFWRTCFQSRICPSINDGIFQIKYPVKMSDSIVSDKISSENERQNGRGDNFSPSSLSSESNLSGATWLKLAHRGWWKVWGWYLFLCWLPSLCHSVHSCIFSTSPHLFQSLPLPLLHPSHHPLLFLRPLLTSQTLLNIVFFLTFRCSLTSSPSSAPSLQPFSHKLDPNPQSRYHALRPY